jgi:hypothetical protein
MLSAAKAPRLASLVMHPFVSAHNNTAPIMTSAVLFQRQNDSGHCFFGPASVSSQAAFHALATINQNITGLAEACKLASSE